MKTVATRFLCDASGCSNMFVTGSTDRTNAYLDLVEAGWEVTRLFSGWKHYCKAHHGNWVKKG